MNDLNAGRRYPALSAIAVVFKVIAVLVAIVGVLMAVFAMKGGYDAAASIAIIVAVVVSTVVIWAIAESIAVIIDIEANTRATAMASRRNQELPRERAASDAQERLPPLGTR